MQPRRGSNAAPTMRSFRGEIDYWRKFLPWYPWPFIMILLVATILGLLVTLLTAVRRVRVAVEDASLARLALAGPNGTSLAYDVSLAVSVHNRNWAMRAVLGAELFFAGERFARVRIQGSSRRSIRPGKTEVYNVVAAGEGAAPLRSAGVAALVKESVAGGGFRLELKLAGEVRYPPHRTRRLEATCPLKLPLASPAGQARFKKVECVV